MSNMFDDFASHVSEYPSDIVPRNGKAFCFFDFSDGVVIEVIGFYEKSTGVVHIQEIKESKNGMLV